MDRQTDLQTYGHIDMQTDKQTQRINYDFGGAIQMVISDKQTCRQKQTETVNH